MPTWFKGAHLQLWFGDVISQADAKRCKTRAPDVEDLRRAVEFFREACADPHSKVLITCDQGASRSPALAYVLIADQSGPGCEASAFDVMLEIRPVAVPNSLVVRLGDTFLQRKGALLTPVRDFYTKINAELFPMPTKGAQRTGSA